MTTHPIILSIDSVSTELSYPTSIDICSRVLPVSFSSELAHIFRDLRRITLLKSYFSRGRAPTTIEMMNFSQMRTSIERRLLHTLNQRESWPVKQQEKAVTQIFSVAGLIYINCTLRRFLPTFAVLKSLKRKLMNICFSEETFDNRDLDNASLGIQLWALCMGSVISLSDAGQSWFAERVAKVMVEMKLDSWRDVEDRLIGLLWNKQMSDAIGGTFWHQVEYKKTAYRTKH